jgi:molybdate/tungstate transport system permease protein
MLAERERTDKGRMRVPLSGGGATLWVLGLCLFCSLLGPILFFLVFLPWPQVPAELSDPNAVSALVTSVVSASLATFLVGLTGIPLGYVLARYTFPGKSLVSLIIYLPLIFPPVVSGIMLLFLYGPYGLIGGPLANIGWEVDDSLVGIVLAQMFVSAPFLIVAARVAFEAVDPLLEQVGMTLGQSRLSLFWRISLPLARRGILAGLILTWVRALGEFGATIVLAYHPYTLPVYVYVQLSGSGVASALPLSLLSLGISIIIIGPVLLIERRAQRSFQVLPGQSELLRERQERSA